jgi:hypothetical protein
MLYMLKGEACTRRAGQLICACWFSPALVVSIYGGRSSALLLLGQISAAGLIRRTTGQTFLARAPYLRFLCAVYCVVVVAGSLYVFSSRAAAFGNRTSSDLVFSFSEHANADISPEVQKYLGDDTALGNLVASSLMSMAYVVQSLPELDYLLIDNPDAGPYAGTYQGGFLFSFLKVCLNFKDAALDDDFERKGWFLTAFGAMYLDFGFWLSPLAMLVLGIVAQRAYQNAVGAGLVGSNLFLVQWYVYILGSPIHSSICTGNSLQVLFSSVIAVWLLRRYRRRGKQAPGRIVAPPHLMRPKMPRAVIRSLLSE